MAKRFKKGRKIDPEGSRLSSRTRCPTIQNVIEEPKLPAAEIIIYGLLILLLMIGSYWRNRVWNNELELWTDCVKKSPNKDRPHNWLGTIYLDQGKYQEAANKYREALRINPDYAEPHYNLGILFMRQGKYEEAIPFLNEALQINPDYAEAHSNLGNVFLNQGKYQEAILHLEEALGINPGIAEAHNNLGTVFLK